MAKKQKRPELTGLQLIALRAFAARHGRTWRHALREAWMSGRDGEMPDGALLRQVRNTIGPSRLDAIEL